MDNVKKDSKGRFVKGHGGGGRKGTGISKKVIELAQSYSTHCVEMLYEIASEKETHEKLVEDGVFETYEEYKYDTKDRQKAIDSILDRALGKPTPAKQDEDDVMDAPQIVVQMTSEEYNKAVEEQKKRRDNKEDDDDDE